MKRYNPSDIEPKWQRIWGEDKRYEAADFGEKPKYYIASMFPYPSGFGMHTGHFLEHSITDAVARFYRAQGKNVMYPMGWDSFGLPAENYAIKTNQSPQSATEANIANFKRQLTRAGVSIDWSREVNTSDPEYYKWTQWVFIKLFEKGLAYQKEAEQWWCDIDKTVLANEQVIDGKCWRHDGPDDPLVTKKRIKQWFFKITNYADALLEEIPALDWPEKIKTAQTNWIGRSEGAEIIFRVAGAEDKISVFSTRPDTIFGATFLVLAPEHPLAKELTNDDTREAVDLYIDEAIKKSEIERQMEGKEKTGVFTGSYAVNPANGEKIPIWVADYVLWGYGTGAIMAVPAHDERDFEFAKKYDLLITNVIEPTFGSPMGDDVHKDAVYIILRNPESQEVVVLDWGPRQDRHGGFMLIGGGVEGKESIEETVKREIAEETGYTNVKVIKKSSFKGHGFFYSNVKNRNMHVSGYGVLVDLVDDTKTELNLDDGEKDKFKVTWQPVDKVFNMLDDGVHKAMYNHLVYEEAFTGEGVLVNSGPFDDAPSFEAREQIMSWLEERGLGRHKTTYKMRDWLISRQRYWGAPIPIIHCKEHGAVAVPEKDLPVLLPEIEDYAPKGDGKSPLARVNDWVNTICPKCGEPAKRETDVMDSYACSSWYLLRYVDPRNDRQAWSPEKAKYWTPLDMYIGGDHAVAHLLYVRFWNHVFYEMGLVPTKEPVKKLVYHGYINAEDGTKMSKSKGNITDPLEVIDAGYGADALRTFELFLGPINDNSNWSSTGIAGIYRFLNRFWNLTMEYVDYKGSEGGIPPEADISELNKITHRTIKKVTDDTMKLNFNTAIAALMEAVNQLYKLKTKGFSSQWQESLEALVCLVQIFAPHLASELWQELGNEGRIEFAGWPTWDESLLAGDIIKIVVQVNGRVRAELEVKKEISEKDVRELALKNINVQKYLLNKAPVKIIYIPKKVVSIVT